uniref:p7 n=1 Tax=Grapevine leafroll-associated virus 1 TaxID=47985 RepID=A0A2P0ZI17_9CLOS|nr:p7 [Grapevine leafroll-associated virus 1]WDZ04337.1 p7 [Grapevine leafroll-associated virus 1]
MDLRQFSHELLYTVSLFILVVLCFVVYFIVRAVWHCCVKIEDKPVREPGNSSYRYVAQP